MASTTGKRVIVVDDDLSLLKLVSTWLRGAGYIVTACETFEDAKHQLAIDPPDVLLTDVRLGAFNGLQLAILAKDEHRELIAVVMSAYDDPTLRKEAERYGARYILKPFTSDVILNSIVATSSVSKG